MSGTVLECRDAVMDLLGTIKTYNKKVLKRVPDTVLTSCVVAVLIGTGKHGQLGTRLRSVRPRLKIRSYVPLGAYPDGTEDVIIGLWDAQVALFNSNVSLKGTARRSNLERYTLGYETVAGVKCRVMESILEVLIAEPTIYKA